MVEASTEAGGTETELLHGAGVDNVMTSPRPADEASTEAASETELLPTVAADNNMPTHLAEDDDEHEVPSECNMDEQPSPIAEQ
jgi:hypothetical protein